LLHSGRDAADDERHGRGDIGVDHIERAHAVDPHHGRGGVTDDAARAARVRRRDDSGEIADVHLAAEDDTGHRATDQRGGDVVEERRQHEDDCEQGEPALPVIGEDVRQQRGDARLFEVLGEQSEAEQQAEQVRQDHPLVLQVQHQPFDARSGLEAGEEELVRCDGGEPGQGDAERPVVKERDAGERHPEQCELDRRTQHHGHDCGDAREQEQSAFEGPRARQGVRHVPAIGWRSRQTAVRIIAGRAARQSRPASRPR